MFHLIVNETTTAMCLSLNKKENLKLKIVLPYNVLKMVNIKFCYEKGVRILYIEKELVKAFNFFCFLITHDVIHVLTILGEKKPNTF